MYNKRDKQLTAGAAVGAAPVSLAFFASAAVASFAIRSRTALTSCGSSKSNMARRWSIAPLVVLGANGRSLLEKASLARFSVVEGAAGVVLETADGVDAAAAEGEWKSAAIPFRGVVVAAESFTGVVETSFGGDGCFFSAAAETAVPTR